jgi:hypothetical protein
METALEQPWPTLLRSPARSRVLLCIDDLHTASEGALAATAAPVLEALRSLLDLGGYITASAAFCRVQRLGVLASAVNPLLARTPPVSRLRCRLTALHVVSSGAATLFTSLDRALLGGMCASFVHSVAAVVDGSDSVTTAPKLAAFLTHVVKEAAAERTVSFSARLFDVHAVRRILCRVHADLTQEPLDFIANASKGSRTWEQLHGGAFFRVFGALAEEESWERVQPTPHGQSTKKV